ncbi:MAG: NADH-quinone oxidoreductase subunit K [Candidatus Omnitrophota bacterium]
MIYFLCFVLFCVGIYGLLIKKNIIKLIISLIIINYSIHIFLILIGFRWQGAAPVLETGGKLTLIVDPLPQAIVLVLLIVNMSAIALLIAVAMKLYQKFKTFNIKEMKN